MTYLGSPWALRVVSHFLPAGKSAAAAAAQIRFLHFVEHGFRSHPGKRFCQRGISADRDVIENVGGVDPHIVFEQHAFLILVKWDFIEMARRFPLSSSRYRSLSIDSIAGAELVDYGRDVLWLRSQIADIRWLDHNQRTSLAKAVASRSPDSDRVSKTALFDFLFE